MAELTEAQRAFIREPNYAVMTTLRADGSPHSTVIWVDEEDGKILFNTAMHRAKWRELDRDPRAAVMVVAPDGYHWVSVSGRVTMTTDGAMDDIERLSQKYDGHSFRPLGEREVRISGRLDPKHVTGYDV
jgi:PPOX class probable F420-dependent enzyme